MIYLIYSAGALIIMLVQCVLLFKILRKSPITYEMVQHTSKAKEMKVVDTATGAFVLKDKRDPIVNDDQTLAEQDT